MDYLKILEDLVKIRTDNEKGVKKAFKYLSDLFNNLGIKNKIIEGCFIAYKGELKKINKIFNSHIDTVKFQREFKREEDKIYGTGVIDAKGNVILMMHAFLTTENSLLVISPDEETKSEGICKFCQYLKNHKEFKENIKKRTLNVIVGEPTDLKVCIGHKGRFEYMVECFGEAKHASFPSSTNPIEIISKVVLDIKNIPLKSIKFEKTYYSSITPTIVKGGVQSNITPDYASVLFDVRSVENDLIKKIDNFLSKKGYYNKIKAGLVKNRNFADFYILKNEELLKKLSDNFDISFFNATCEAFYFNKFLNADAIIYGVGRLELAHSKNEHLYIKEFFKGIKEIEKLANLVEE
ncbi:MAG: M20 family metallopeptidase [Methanococci archaeon]|nr:M20 family metallopeptidase [Methanococci archaeon]